MVAESSAPESSNVQPPLVSVIIPARNEERNLDRCLRSLVIQRGVPFELIVVDDESMDATREIAMRFAIAQNQFSTTNRSLSATSVLSARTPLPDAWTGKANACWTGAAAATGAWLLFTDADTEHVPGSLANAVQEANDHSAALLSYSPEQALHGFAQTLLMPVIFGELASTYRPSSVSDPKSKAAAANGQYLLIRRNVYDRIGGHAAVRSSLLEDVDLARLAKADGAKLRFRLGRGIVRTYMYSGWADMRDGWTKNLALLFPDARVRAAKRILEFLVGFGGVVGGVYTCINNSFAIAASCLAVGGFAMSASLVRIRRAHFGWKQSLLSVLGIPLYSWLLLRSAHAHRSGDVAWKGRTYSPTATSAGSGESN